MDRFLAGDSAVNSAVIRKAREQRALLYGAQPAAVPVKRKSFFRMSGFVLAAAFGVTAGILINLGVRGLTAAPQPEPPQPDVNLSAAFYLPTKQVTQPTQEPVIEVVEEAPAVLKAVYAETRTLNVDRLIRTARQQMGKRYVWGAKGPNRFDCSGFVYYCLNQSGYNIKYMTSAGWRRAGYTPVKSMGDLQPGDVCVFKEHVGIYIGGGEMIHASSAAGRVLISSLNTSYRHRNWVTGMRLT
ncbi:MAG: C40 family peptidase [Clostridia bacterium]|nr:C40 family peptidase [Clostridia bacterium]